jgi:hypothetical protein
VADRKAVTTVASAGGNVDPLQYDLDEGPLGDASREHTPVVVEEMRP